jgi:alpha-amylase
MAEGWDKYLDWRSPNFLYSPPGCKKIKILLKNYKLSDDIAFRFGNKQWDSWPLSADTYADWIHSNHGNGETVNLFMDYESFGEHQWADTGIFEFLKALPETLLRHPETSFKTATETVQAYDSMGEYDVPDVLTWADTDRDLTAWNGNDIQKDALAATYRMEENVMKTGKPDLIEKWRKLQTSDHFYYMCTKWSNDGDVHAYFSPYESPYDAYIAFMNALSDLKLRVDYVAGEKDKAAALKEKAAEEKPVAAKVKKKKPKQPPKDVDPQTPTVLKPKKPDPVQEEPPLQNIWKRLRSILPLVSRN